MHSFFITHISQGLLEVAWCREGRIHRLLVPVLLLLQPLRVASASSVSNASAPDLFGSEQALTARIGLSAWRTYLTCHGESKKPLKLKPVFWRREECFQFFYMGALADGCAFGKMGKGQSDEEMHKDFPLG